MTELVTNVITYGYRGVQAPPDAVALRFVQQLNSIEMDIEDQGRHFDPLAYELAPPAASLRDAEIGGRGVLLVRRTAAGLRYRRSAQRNHVTVSFVTNAQGADAAAARCAYG